jgi:hypothetical protein
MAATTSRSSTAAGMTNVNSLVIRLCLIPLVTLMPVINSVFSVV